MLDPPSSGRPWTRAALSPNSLGQPFPLCSVLSHSLARGVCVCVCARIPGPPPPAGQHPINPHIKSLRRDRGGGVSGRGRPHSEEASAPFSLSGEQETCQRLGPLPQPLAPALAPPDKKLLYMRRAGWPGLTRALKEAVAPDSPGCPFPHAEASFSCN